MLTAYRPKAHAWDRSLGQEARLANAQAAYARRLHSVTSALKINAVLPVPQILIAMTAIQALLIHAPMIARALTLL
jgi:hypothetical protein